MRALAETEAEAERRRALVGEFVELEKGCREAQWLKSYLTDANRFKVGSSEQASGSRLS
jgi:hypothetical protein